MRFIALGLFASLSLPSFAAQAQDSFSAPESEVRVNSSFNMSDPVAASDEPALLVKQAAARKAVYEIAGQECKLLMETIASQCRLESLNVNSSVQGQAFRDPATLYLSTNGNASFRILLKR
ncbi:MAG TPA: hypothetical protein VKV77_09350 [Methylovirgula sp.]|nr:hypothetical protein [Methylovirgula sp.]